MRLLRRTILFGGVVIAAMVMAAVPASAHECFNASRADQANAAIAKHSHGWFDIQTSQFLAIFVVSCVQDSSQPGCPPTPPTVTSPDDVSYIQNATFDQLLGEIFGFVQPQSQAVADVMTFTTEVASIANTCFAVPTHYLTLNNATAGGGAPAKNATNGKGIDHFPDLYSDQLFTSYVAAFTGVPAC